MTVIAERAVQIPLPRQEARSRPKQDGLAGMAERVAAIRTRHREIAFAPRSNTSGLTESAKRAEVMGQTVEAALVNPQWHVPLDSKDGGRTSAHVTAGGMRHEIDALQLDTPTTASTMRVRQFDTATGQMVGDVELVVPHTDANSVEPSAVSHYAPEGSDPVEHAESRIRLLEAALDAPDVVVENMGTRPGPLRQVYPLTEEATAKLAKDGASRERKVARATAKLQEYRDHTIDTAVIPRSRVR